VKTACPACGATFSLDTILGNEGAREAVMAALAMPAPIGKLLVQYLALFRPAQRQLSFDRVANLLNELLPMISTASIERNGRTWSAPQEYWSMALSEMIAKRDNLTLPLKSHGYLLAIIEGYSNKAETKKETHTEARKGGYTPVGSASLPVVKKEKAGPRSAMPGSVKAVLLKEKNHGNS
jgi:hypothetical protein